MQKTKDHPISDVQNLHKAFLAFSQETKRLEKAYVSLNQQFQRVNTELEASNKALGEKVQELDNMTTYLNSILSNMAQGIVFIRHDGVVTTYNNEAEDILKIPARELLYFSIWDHFPDDVFGFSMREALETLTAPDPKIADWQERKLEVMASAVQGGPEGMILLLRDITEFQRLQTLANQNDQMKELGEMAASVAHEIRNPLGGIEGFASLLYRDLEDRPKLQEMAEQIVNGSKTLNRLVSSVLHYSRPMEMHKTRCSVRRLLDETRRLVQADKKLVGSVKLKVDGHAGSCSMDADMIKSALLNLAVNALHAMPEGGSLHFLCQRVDEHVEISVRDTGEGIPLSRLEKIFQPFFTTKAHGNGFGLAEVHRIVNAHGGQIDVQSEEKVGSTFTLRLPATGIGGK